MSNETEKIRAQLKERLASLHGRIAEINETLRQPEDDDLEEQAADLDDDAVLESLSYAGKTEAYLIEAALRRLDKGTYGKCLDCGREISRGRLKALPEAERCLACAQRTAGR